jgi:hypothetical protein
MDAPAPSPAASKAIRLTFEYDGDQVRLLSQQRVDMVVPASAPVTGFDGHKGVWAELKDGQNRTLYRQVMHNPLRGDVEVFSDDPARNVARHPTPQRKGVFVVLVPDTDEGREVVLSSSPTVQAGPQPMALANRPARQIFRVKLNRP